MATQDEARQAIFDKVAELAPKAPTSEKILALAEAFAWAADPAQPHGG